MSKLAEVVRQALKAQLRQLRVALPGRIVAYDKATQTADIDLQLEVPVVAIDARGEERRGEHEHEELPRCLGVPVGHPKGGGYYVHFPLQPGDFVWVMFADFSLDEFIRTGKLSQPTDVGAHELFPYALPAVDPSTPIDFGEADPDDILPDDQVVIGLEAEGPRILIASNKITIDGNLTVTGTIECDGEVTAGNANPATRVGVTTHQHPSAMGPTGAPIPGS